jgi:acyl-CoA reductase-like NAD-dependent aldehyde dehydrogenase
MHHRCPALLPSFHTDPATDEVIAAVPDMDAAAAAAAVDSASAALAAWRATLAKDRAAILERMHELMHAHSEDLAHVMTLECGKPLAESRGEVAYGASFYKWFAEEARRINGQVLQTHAADKRLVTLKQPVGVASMYARKRQSPPHAQTPPWQRHPFDPHPSLGPLDPKPPLATASI